MNFQQLLTKKCGFGNHQKLQLIMLFLVYFNQGSHLMYSILILPPIYYTYSLYDYFTLEIILSLFYVGIAIGSFISVFLSDKYGRKMVLFVSTILLGINSYLHTSCITLNCIGILQLLHGIIWATIQPQGYLIYMESVSQNYRNLGMMVMSIAKVLGKLFAVLAYVLVINSMQNNWAMLIGVSSLLTFALSAILFVSLKESLLYLYNKREYQKLALVMNQMIEFNYLNGELTNETELATLEDSEACFIQVQLSSIFVSIRMLFEPKWKWITIKIMTIWFLIEFIHKANLMLQPYILMVPTDAMYLQQYAVDYAGQILGYVPACIVLFFALGQDFFGRRKNLLIFSFVLCMISNFRMYQNLNDISGYSFYTELVTFSMTIGQIVIMLMTLEIYPTNLRSAAFGLGVIVGVSGLFIMNIVPFILVQINHFWPFLYFALICPIAILCSFSLEIETQRVELDEVHKEQTIELSDYSSEKQVEKQEEDLEHLLDQEGGRSPNPEIDLQLANQSEQQQEQPVNKSSSLEEREGFLKNASLSSIFKRMKDLNIKYNK